MSEGVGRRDFMRTAALATGGLVLVGAEAARAFTGNAAVDAQLFQDINRAKDPAHKQGLEKLHAPVIELPATIKKGEAFAVNVAIGETLHPMGPAHYIDWVEILAGNEPAGRLDFREAFSQPKATFFITLDKPVTLVARIYCNLHGLWQSEQEVTPV